jgi:hypothetical protein
MSEENLSERLTAVEQTPKNIQATQAILSQLALHAADRAREHEQRQKEHEEWLKRHEIAMQEFDGKLNALIDIISRNQGGMEARPQ